MRPTVSIRELNQATSAVVRRVADTQQSMVILSNNVPTGVVLSPADPVSGVLAELVASGRAVAPTTVNGMAVGPPVGSARHEMDVAAALAAERDEDNRW